MLELQYFQQIWGLGVFFFEFFGNLHKIIGRVNFIAESAPCFLLKKHIQVTQSVRFDSLLDDETIGHGHHPGYQFRPLRRKITVEARFFGMRHDFFQGL